jgi:hypothetical protein
MHIEVTDETQPLIDEGSASAAEMPAHEAVAMADDEGGRTSEVEWLTQISKHLHQDGYLGHEVVRQIENLLEAFSPAPRGDWGWFLRRSQDIAVRTLRQLIDRYGHRSQEQLGNFEVRAMHIVRLYIEEAFRRQLVDSETPVLKSALCGFMVSMRNIEHNTLPQDTTKNKKTNIKQKLTAIVFFS